MTPSQPVSAAPQISLTNDSLTKIRKNLFRKPTAALGALVTSEELAALRLRCQSHWARKSLLLNSTWLKLAIALLLGLGAVLVIGGGIAEPMRWGQWVSVVCFVFFLGTLASFLGILLITTMSKELLGLDSAELLEDALAPLRTTWQGCERALDLIKKSPKAQTYRDVVLQSGRELCEFDLSVLHTLKAEDWWIDHHAKNDRACKALHGILVV